MPKCVKCGKDAHSDWVFGKREETVCVICEAAWRKKNKKFDVKEFADWVLGEKKDE